MLGFVLLLFPALVGAGAALYLRQRRGENPVDFGPWKLMAGLIAMAIVSILGMVGWVAITQPVFGMSNEPMTTANYVANVLIVPSLALPGLYVGAAVASALTGVKRPRTFLLVWTALLPVIGMGWFLVAVTFSCVTTGSCL